MEQLALLSLSRPFYILFFLSPFLVSRSLGDPPKLGYGRREDVRIFYYRKYDVLLDIGGLFVPS